MPGIGCRKPLPSRRTRRSRSMSAAIAPFILAQCRESPCFSSPVTVESPSPGKGAPYGLQRAIPGSVTSRCMVEKNDAEHGHRLDEGDHPNVGIRLPVGQSTDGQQGDDGPVVRQCITSPRCHGSDPMKNFRRHADRICPGRPIPGHQDQDDGHAARGRTCDARRRRHGHGLRNERIYRRSVCPEPCVFCLGWNPGETRCILEQFVLR